MNSLDSLELYRKSNNDIAAELGKKFKSCRIALRLTQKEISLQSGVSVMTIVRFEKGESGSIRLDNLIALMRAIQRLDDMAELIPQIPESLYGPEKSEVKRVRIAKNER